MSKSLDILACNPEMAWRCSEIESGKKSAQGIVDGYRTIFMSDRDRISNKKQRVNQHFTSCITVLSLLDK